MVIEQDSGMELIKSIPKYTIGKSKYDRMFANSKLRVTKDVLKKMWGMLSKHSDFNLQLRTKKVIIDYLESIDKREWVPTDLNTNMEITNDLDIKVVAIIIYRWANGDFDSKYKAMELVRKYGIYMRDKLEEDDNNLSFKMKDMLRLMCTGLSSWSNTTLDEMTLYKMEQKVFDRKFTQQRIHINDIVKDEIGELQCDISLNEINGEILDFSSKLLRDYRNPSKAIDDIMNKVENLSVKFNGLDVNDAIDMVIDFNDENIDDVLKEAEKKLISSNPYNTGMVGINKMTQGGLRAGEYCSIGALTHNYKSGLTTTLTCGLCVSNDWEEISKDEGDSYLLYLSLEDKLDNFYRNAFEVLWASGYRHHMTFCGSLMSIDNGKTDKDKMLDIPFQLIAKDVTSSLQSRGIKIITMKADPTIWSMQGMLGVFENLMLDGKNIKIIVTDYFDKLPDSNMGDNGVTGEAKRMKIRKARNWALKRGITWINPWQLNSDVGRYLTGGASIQDFMRYMSSAGKYMGNSTLASDIDLELFTKTFVDNSFKEDMKFLGISRGKHRGFGDVSDRDKVVFYEFENGLKPGLDNLGGSSRKHKHDYKEFSGSAPTNSEEVPF